MPEDSYIVVLVLIVPVLLVFIGAKRKRRRANLAMPRESELPIEGTEQERLESEAYQRDWRNQNRRVQLVETHVLFERFNTIDGYSEEYMESLVGFLRDQGVTAEVYFQDTVPVGIAASLITRQGQHELYVLQADAEKTGPLIEEFKRRG